jgi:peptidoglycan/xylan/chitin deacetylase (PgdA/CDA1 family)
MRFGGNWPRRFKQLFQHKAIVLMYHRVATLSLDPWQLAVQPDRFERQLKLLQNKYNVISLSELVTQLADHSLSDNSICITFDDGYSDNFFNAIPLLEKYHCPASFFITTQYIGRNQLFWWDELQNIILATGSLPPKMSMPIDGQLFEFNLENDTVLSHTRRDLQAGWVSPEEPPTRRCELYLAIWEKLRPLPEEVLQSTLRQVRTWAGYQQPPDYLSIPLTTSQLNCIARHPLFEIGIHTVTHPALSFQSREVQLQEISDSRQCLEKMCSRSMNILTYPYGDYNDTTINVVKQEKLQAAFTTVERVITKRSDPYCLGRFQVRNWKEDEFEKQLSTWIKNQ